MASGANVTVKKNDDTTDVVYTFTQPFNSPQNPAIYLAPTLGNAIDHSPSLRVIGRDSADGKNRVLRMTYRYPEVANPSAGVYVVNGYVSWTAEVTLPRSLAQSTTWYEAISQFANLLDSTELKTHLKAGYAPT